MTLEEFNKNFKYVPDTKDSWRVLKHPYEGDCDDYAITVLYLIEKGWFKVWLSLLTFKAIIWFVKDPKGQNHAVLWHKNYGYIDNWFPYWRSTLAPHKKIMPVIVTTIAIKLFLGKIFKP